MEIPDCKSCKESVKANKGISSAEIEDAIEKLVKAKRVRTVDDKTYEARLLKCYSCKYLDLGTTCMQCGCVVQIRAKLLEMNCPFPKNNMWNNPYKTK